MLGNEASYQKEKKKKKSSKRNDRATGRELGKQQRVSLTQLERGGGRGWASWKTRLSLKASPSAHSSITLLYICMWTDDHTEVNEEDWILTMSKAKGGSLWSRPPSISKTALTASHRSEPNDRIITLQNIVRAKQEKWRKRVRGRRRLNKSPRRKWERSFTQKLSSYKCICPPWSEFTESIIINPDTFHYFYQRNGGHVPW